MKKVLLLAVAGCLATGSFSQVRFGGQVTGNVGSASTNAPSSFVEKSMRIGYGAGVVSEIKLSESFALRSSLNFLQKPNAIKSLPVFEENNAKAEIKTSLNYLELPVTLQYKVPVGNANLFFAAGPSLGYGISGKIKVKASGLDDDGKPFTTEGKVDAFKSEDKDGAGMKRFDFSANALAGIELPSGLFINAGYLASLKNIVGNDAKYKNYGFQLTVGKWFN